MIPLRQCEAKLLGVVVDVLDALKLQADEALVTSSERLLAKTSLHLHLASSDSFLCLGLCIFRCTLGFRGIVSLAVVVVSSTGEK